MEKISGTDRVRNEVLHTVNRKTANWIGNILHRNCVLNTLLKDRNEGKTRKKT